MSCSSLTLFLHPPRLSHLKPHLYSLTSSTLTYKSHICFCSTSEDARWLREEQRWLREEQRWLREEQRWARDRDSLLREIADLKLKLQALQAGASSENIANIAGLLQSLKEKNQIAERGSTSRPLELEDDQVKEVFTVSEVKKKTTHESLRKGSEGERVREMQEALLKWGFYSGEEDMEFSNFSSGTERAIKTWQASIGLPEDGIMTEELLERLYNDPQAESAVVTKEDANGAAGTSVTEISEVKQIVLKEDAAELDESYHRVFLLGENRWEEPSRLNRNKGNEANTTKCLTCRGEGRLLCSECDGTGEPNIEEQFLEWIDEGAKCPYCEGLGFTVCDVCGGK
ncbi:protein disulfide isomerase pTAC5, chloroplastic isoform X2 [Argentina anserina]|uniref:protein disulfide isomerase pTAC5, chloroplastic isoform X2 n=1 Tax=Argentina anserina TaxID=57926 RepID=UPI0021763099|nr:protein disulfide isomerase pTAC5, chloroplastic isoform X2 [Potentilla anserina]